MNHARSSSPETVAGLSPQQHQQWQHGLRLYAKIGRAIQVATFDSWATTMFAALTLLAGFWSWTGLILGGAMAWVAYNAFHGRNRLQVLDIRAAAGLGWNQIVLGSALMAYAVWNIAREWLYGSALLADVAAQVPEAAGMLNDFQPMARLITTMVYGALILMALLFQGGMALYYFTRASYLQQYQTQAAPWVRQLQVSRRAA